MSDPKFVLTQGDNWWRLSAAVAAGILLGGAAVQTLHAQASPRTYLFAEAQVTDAEAYKPYIPETPQIIAQYGGRYVVRGGQARALEGAEPAGRVAIVEFASLAHLGNFWNSPEYREVAPIRRAASKSRLFAAEGLQP
jgi:uncharacterized protein (DUF1330 family)